MAITEKSLAKASAMSSQALGSWFEAEVQARLKDLKENTPLYFLRLYDSKSAGNLMPSQPADFIVTARQGAFLVETKASAKYASLASCLASNVSKGQAVDHFMWNRSGHPSLFIFCGVSDDVLEVWDGEYVAHCRRKGERMRKSQVRLRVQATSIDQYLKNFFL